MFLNIENKNLKVKFTDEYLKLPKQIQKKIDLKWKEIIKENPILWDGDIFCVINIKIDDNDIELLCKKSKYSHYLYQERIGLPQEYGCNNICAGSILKTKDGFFVICELDDTTSYPGALQIPGGNCDKKDIENNEINYLETIIRETKEEINIDLNDKKLVKEYKINGFYEGSQPGVEIFAIVNLNMTKDELNKHFNEYYEYLKANNGELEIKKLHFLHEKNCIEELEKLDNPKRKYLGSALKNNIKK